MVTAMRRATKVLGGNLLLVGGFGGTVIINANTGAQLAETEATHGVGWALRVKDGALEAPVKPVGVGTQL